MSSITPPIILELLHLCIYKKAFLFFSLFFSTPAAYGSSQARDAVGAAAASLHHSHSNAGSKPHLQFTPQLMATPDPQPTLRGWRLDLHLQDSCWVCYRWATAGTPKIFFYGSTLVVYSQLVTNENSSSDHCNRCF